MLKFCLPFILSACAALFGSTAIAAGSGSSVVVLARASNDVSEYEFSATRAQDGGADIVIRCVDACAKASPRYRENTGYAPGWVLLPKDGSTRFISVWTSGSAYAVMVYDVGGPKILKVLEAGSRTPPAVELDEQGNEFFQLCTEEDGCSEYHWRDGKYAVRFVRRWVNPAATGK